jgi:hypothetical protein
MVPESRAEGSVAAIGLGAAGLRFMQSREGSARGLLELRVSGVARLLRSF